MILNGKKIADEIFNSLKELQPPEGKFVVIQVGNDPVSNLYVLQKKAMAEKLNFVIEVQKFDEIVSEDELKQEITQLNNDPKVRAIMVQMPLPKNIDRIKISELIDVKKDVDGFSYILEKSPFTFFPPTILAIDEILRYYKISKINKKILIVGEGFLVGKPLFHFYKDQKLAVSVLKKDDADYEKKLKESDIIVVATGGGRVFSKDDFKSGVTVIDASTVSDEGKIRGDVNLADWPNGVNIAPVPGGVGPLTVAMLMKNYYSLS
ncbi:MAG: bifunctional 5,10-methylenetetrahydrofolate dehydrogenase/5,10-methenyltetrahydrofolate cyclohydrolase [Candidatus Berkelbacteria bacterium]|nr:bifunctional 5,10-methylenetetrahydrofolate dehydrogenase/5,10-methenyltetrahydrofolate cyclohydrolase [Candidatus Berkelbacteria bacterium]